MEKTEECRRYKWSTAATNLLISIWCHDMVQNHLKMSTRNQPIWESIARYMNRKGFSVTGIQCRTRIKNMLCTYQEAVKKSDPSIIEPYYEVFKKVMSNKNMKKKAPKKTKLNHSSYSDETDEDDNIISDCYPKQSELNLNTSLNIEGAQMEFLDVSNQEPQQPELINNNEFLKGLENIIMKALEKQTKSLHDVINMQSQTLEKLLICERERMECILATERESRKQLVNKLDEILNRLETNASQISHTGVAVETRQNNLTNDL